MAPILAYEMDCCLDVVGIRGKVAVAGLEVDWCSGSGNFCFLFFIECMYL